MPPIPERFVDTISEFQPFRSATLEYILKRSDAKSEASLPPAPALISRKTFLLSATSSDTISTLISSLGPIEFAFNPGIPNSKRKNSTENLFDRIFIWQGDYRLLIAIIKYVEDKLNIQKDIEVVGVQAIILVEDDVKFYSTYLPIIYSQVFEQSQQLISEGVNTTHRFLRMRARPKILLCTTYEEAWGYFKKYQRYILGVISDINFKHNGKKDPQAGINLAKEIKKVHEDIPILLRSESKWQQEIFYLLKIQRMVCLQLNLVLHTFANL